MTASLTVSVLEKWINGMLSVVQESEGLRRDPDFVKKIGMRDALWAIRGKLETWVRHQKRMEILKRTGKKLLITQDLNTTEGRYRKFEWYENGGFLSLSWRHAADAETGELMLEMQDVVDLSTTWLIYEGDLSFDDLKKLARKGGLEAIRNEGNRGEWVEKVWTRVHPPSQL